MKEIRQDYHSKSKKLRNYHPVPRRMVQDEQYSDEEEADMSMDEYYSHLIHYHERLENNKISINGSGKFISQKNL